MRMLVKFRAEDRRRGDSKLRRQLSQSAGSCQRKRNQDAGQQRRTVGAAVGRHLLTQVLPSSATRSPFVRTNPNRAWMGRRSK
jgi:hypothetical protein